MDKTCKSCKTCKHSQEGFFDPNVLFCGAKNVQVVEVKADYKCDWWCAKNDDDEQNAGNKDKM